MKAAEASGRFHYRPPGVALEDHLLTGAGDEPFSAQTPTNLILLADMVPPAQHSAGVPAQSVPAPIPLNVTSQEDDDLDLDLDNMNLDDIDTSDLNFDDEEDLMD
uniref:Uncharacterized protein n=2 Tax=Graphocephala atropunctata TaxID=36148 RepID=A0A1B6KZR7_9HEMI